MLRGSSSEEGDPLLLGGKETDDTNNLLHTNDVSASSSSIGGTDGTTTSSSGTHLALRVKSFKDVEIRINDSSSVSQVKQAVRQALGDQAKDRYLRLICKGRLLAPDTSALREFSVRNGDVLHAVLAAAGVQGGQQAALAHGISRRYRGTGVGAGGRPQRAGADDEDDEDGHNDGDGNGNSGDEEEGSRLGFDRLRSTGLSRGEVSAIRSYFSRNVDRYVQAHPEVVSEAANGETDSRRRRLLHEDAWMQAQGPTSEFRFNLNQNNPFLRLSAETPLFRATTVGTDRDFLWGFLLGFFVGFLMLVWVWMPTVPHKQKLGILTGISFQLAMNFLKDNPEEADFVED